MSKNDLKLVVNNENPEKEGENKSPELTVTQGGGHGPIRLVRLITGEVLMGFYKEIYEEETNMSAFGVEATKNTKMVSNSFVLHKPVLVGAGIDQRGNPQVNMMEYMFFAENDNFYFKKADMLNLATPNKGLADHYRQKMSGLVMPTNGLIT